MSQRLFVALRPPPAVREALLACMGGVPDARWQNDNQLHLTLAFLGEVDRHGARAAADALAAIHQPPFELRLGAPGSFDAGRVDWVSVLWMSVEEIVQEPPARREEGPLFRLAASVRQALRGAGLAVDSRRFLPHITLARFPRGGAPGEALRRWLADGRWPALAFTVDDFHLVESRMGVGGSHYWPLANYKLADM